jgi:hypothetical protein
MAVIQESDRLKTESRHTPDREPSSDALHNAMCPLVLSGPPRSGTTLFSALLDGHSQINWFIDEGFFFEHLYELGPDNVGRFVKAASLGIENLIAGIRERSIMPRTDQTTDFPSLKIKWSEDSFRKALAGKKATTLRELWVVLRDAYMSGFGYAPRRYVSMKAADYGRSVFGALEYFPEARGIIIVREPVAAFNSLKMYRQKYNRNLVTWPALVKAAADMNKIGAQADRYGGSRLLIVRYEDFEENPAPVMHALCRWSGIPFEHVLTQPSMMGAPWSNN